MNILQAKLFSRTARRWLGLLAGMLAICGAKAEAQAPNRILLVFETSPALKKNLPAVRQTLDVLFSSNLQNEMQNNDDLAVWTVDQELRTATYPLASWSPEDAVVYSAQLKDFLGHQKFTRHASLAAVQPLLNHVVETSERLTVLIFCDSESRLLGTPYDSGVNEIITNSAARTKGAEPLFILVLRAYHGAYAGCSVNRSLPLNFPKFPPPPKLEPAPKPKPEPPPVVNPAPAPAFAVAPVPALIIVGTNAGTDLSALSKPAPTPAPSPVVSVPATNSPPPAAPAPAAITPAPAVKIVAAPPANPAPNSNPPAPPPVVAAAPATVTNPPSRANAVAPSAETASADTVAQWPMFLGGGLLVLAAVLVGWLLARARRPHSSLITSSMQDDPRLPPRK